MFRSIFNLIPTIFLKKIDMRINLNRIFRLLGMLGILYLLIYLFYSFYILIKIDIALLGAEDKFYIALILLSYLLPPILSFKKKFGHDVDRKIIHRDTLIATASAAIIFLLRYNGQVINFLVVTNYYPVVVLVPLFLVCCAIYYLLYFAYRLFVVNIFYSIFSILYKLY